MKEEVREARGIRALETFGRDLRYGVRMLRKRPGFTAVAVLSLAIGIGANTAIFSMVNTVLLRDQPLDRPDELVNVYLDLSVNGNGVLSYPDVEDLRDGTRDVFSGIGATTTGPVIVDRAQGVEVAMAEVVTGNFFSVLGIEALIGRTIGPQDDVARGAHPMVMLGYAYWQSRFGGDPDVVGRELRLAGRAYTVVSVAPADYPGPQHRHHDDVVRPDDDVGRVGGFRTTGRPDRALVVRQGEARARSDAGRGRDCRRSCCRDAYCDTARGLEPHRRV